MSALNESKQKRKSEQQVSSSNKKKNKLNAEADMMLNILKSWMVMADGSFQATARYISAVDGLFNDIYPVDSQKDISEVLRIEAKKVDFSKSFLFAASEVMVAKRLSLDSVELLQRSYEDHFVDVTEPCPKLKNNVLYTVIEVLLEKCNMNENCNVTDRKVYNKKSMLHLPILSSVSYACGVTTEMFEECETNIWNLLKPYVSVQRKLKVINKEFLSNFMYEFSKESRFYINRHMIKPVQQNFQSDYAELQNKLLCHVESFTNPIIQFFFSNCPNFYFETSFLLSTPHAVAQDQASIHQDFTNKKTDVCFTLIVPINLSCSIILVNKQKKTEEFEIKRGQFFKFPGECSHIGGKNIFNSYQFRIQVLFAKRKQDLPEFDTVKLIGD